MNTGLTRKTRGRQAFAGSRYANCKRAALGVGAHQFDPIHVSFGNPAGNRKAEARAAIWPAAGAIGAEKSFENPGVDLALQSARLLIESARLTASPPSAA